MSKAKSEAVAEQAVDVAGLVAEGVALTVRIDAKRTALQAQVKAAEQIKQECFALEREREEIEYKLIALGAGKYPDAAGNVAAVSLGFPQTQQPDTYELGSEKAEEEARTLAGDHFGKLFDRHVYFTPKEGFVGIVKALMKGVKAKKLIELCLRPGKLTGGRRASVSWRLKG